MPPLFTAVSGVPAFCAPSSVASRSSHAGVYVRAAYPGAASTSASTPATIMLTSFFFIVLVLSQNRF